MSKNGMENYWVLWGLKSDFWRTWGSSRQQWGFILDGYSGYTFRWVHINQTIVGVCQRKWESHKFSGCFFNFPIIETNVKTIGIHHFPLLKLIYFGQIPFIPLIGFGVVLQRFSIRFFMTNCWQWQVDGHPNIFGEPEWFLPPIYGVYWGMVYDCFNCISQSIFEQNHFFVKAYRYDSQLNFWACRIYNSPILKLLDP